VEEQTVTGRRRLPAAALVVGLGLLTSGIACGDDDDPTGGTSASATGAVEGTVQVFAAASLTDAFEEVATAFESDNPGAEVTFSFGGSSSLVEQLLDGAPADVLATADERTMGELVDAGDSPIDGEPEVFAHNRLVLVVPAGNPGDVAELADLADDDLFVGLCAEEVPCGNLAAAGLDDAGISAAVDSYEPDVRSLLTKLVAGELDAGLVYETDAQAAADDVDVVTAPELEERTTSYPIAALDRGGNPDAGAAFAEYVVQDEAQGILATYGFVAP
jgi:molybdate transport system substrate-binding protein